MAKLMFQTSLTYVFQPRIIHRNPTLTIVPESVDIFRLHASQLLFLSIWLI